VFAVPQAYTKPRRAALKQVRKFIALAHHSPFPSLAQHGMIRTKLPTLSFSLG